MQARIEENRIVGPISDEFAISQIIRNGQTATAFTVDEIGNPKNHGFSVGVAVNISGVTGPTDQDALLYNGSFLVTSAQGNQFTYQMSSEPSGNAIGSNILVKVEIDTVDSASPYVFNMSLDQCGVSTVCTPMVVVQLVSNRWWLHSLRVSLYKKMTVHL